MHQVRKQRSASMQPKLSKKDGEENNSGSSVQSVAYYGFIITKFMNNPNGKNTKQRLLLYEKDKLKLVNKLKNGTITMP